MLKNEYFGLKSKGNLNTHVTLNKRGRGGAVFASRMRGCCHSLPPVGHALRHCCPRQHRAPRRVRGRAGVRWQHGEACWESQGRGRRGAGGGRGSDSAAWSSTCGALLVLRTPAGLRYRETRNTSLWQPCLQLVCYTRHWLH